MDNFTLLIDCPDELGIVHKTTGVLYRQGLNIEYQGEFVDKSASHFFMRTVVSGEVKPDVLLAGIWEAVPSSSRVRLIEHRKKDIVLFATKEPHCLGDLLIRHEYGDINACIVAVISNHNTLESLVRRFGVPFHHVPHQDKTREEHEGEIRAVLENYKPEYLALAKYMRVLSPAFARCYAERIINIHHSFLPAFIGAKPYQQAYERGVKIIGATAHFATESLDQGPIIAQDVLHVHHGKSAMDMMRAGRNVEKKVFAEALQMVLEDKVIVFGNKTVVFD